MPDQEYLSFDELDNGDVFETQGMCFVKRSHNMAEPNAKDETWSIVKPKEKVKLIKKAKE